MQACFRMLGEIRIQGGPAVNAGAVMFDNLFQCGEATIVHVGWWCESSFALGVMIVRIVNSVCDPFVKIVKTM